MLFYELWQCFWKQGKNMMLDFPFKVGAWGQWENLHGSRTLAHFVWFLWRILVDLCGQRAVLKRRSLKKNPLWTALAPPRGPPGSTIPSKGQSAPNVHLKFRTRRWVIPPPEKTLIKNMFWPYLTTLSFNFSFRSNLGLNFISGFKETQKKESKTVAPQKSSHFTATTKAWSLNEK